MSYILEAKVVTGESILHKSIIDRSDDPEPLNNKIRQYKTKFTKMFLDGIIAGVEFYEYGITAVLSPVDLSMGQRRIELKVQRYEVSLNRGDEAVIKALELTEECLNLDAN